MAVKISSFGLVCEIGVIYMYIWCLIWSCEKNDTCIHASIWRCFMHDIIIEIREKACVHVHHLEISTQEWKWKQLSAIIHGRLSQSAQHRVVYMKMCRRFPVVLQEIRK